MAFKIDKPGFYQTRDGRKVWAFPIPIPPDGFLTEELEYPICGFFSERSRGFYTWTANGEHTKIDAAGPLDLIGPWAEPRKPIETLALVTECGRVVSMGDPNLSNDDPDLGPLRIVRFIEAPEIEEA